MLNLLSIINFIKVKIIYPIIYLLFIIVVSKFRFHIFILIILIHYLVKIFIDHIKFILKYAIFFLDQWYRMMFYIHFKMYLTSRNMGAFKCFYFNCSSKFY